MNYRSVADLNRDIIAWAKLLPRDLELIVGIPRSGLLAANLLALHLNLPMTDVEGLVCGRVFACGQRTSGRIDGPTFLSVPRKVLIVDDTVSAGQQKQLVRQLITSASLPHVILYGAVYAASRDADQLVDSYYTIVPTPRYFEWNILHHGVLAMSCVDIDGVLCRDPTPEENDDGPQYLQFIREVRPTFVPTVPVGWLVTSRLEKYRRDTEEWLVRNGIQFRTLLMMDLPDKQARLASGSHASFKARHYRDTQTCLFIESSPQQAMEIAHLSGKYVFCTDTMQMIPPTLPAQGYRNARRWARRLRRRCSTRLRELWGLRRA